MPLSLHGFPLPKSVQEMSMNGDEPPPEFHAKDGSFGCIGSSDLSASVSGGLLSSSKDEQGKLRLALCSGGCFQAIGHGISNSFLNKVRGVAKQFFQLPQEEKQKVFPEHQRKLNLWPANPDKFRHAYLTLSRRTVSYELNSCREVLHEYSIKQKQLVDLLFKAMAKSLALEENSFSDQFGDNPVMHVRSWITVFLQDELVEGLQFAKEEKWITVPVIPHALVVNLGDQMQIMSNGIFKSPVHRVVTNADKLRISVAMFNEVEPEKEIGPVEGLIDEKRSRLYRNVKNYASFNYECFQKGKVPLEEVKFHA
ncbi:hypothetical protein GOBAR_AA34324 [Gossypium barbadense]|uniref:Fe2OG dioxygenase domain-containing protein n=1 Tax=Gossypium barbadense TaxID=3634 RepID=A0A2P5W5J5_GOSBA|nr:hypothetical protein GOBAR_AA34324 [Gossypium barbadense]